MQVDINVYSDDPKRLRGTVKRTISEPKKQGSHIIGYITLFRKAYYVIDRSVILRKDIIKKLIKGRQLMQIE